MIALLQPNTFQLVITTNVTDHFIILNYGKLYSNFRGTVRNARVIHVFILIASQLLLTLTDVVYAYILPNDLATVASRVNDFAVHVLLPTG